MNDFPELPGLRVEVEKVVHMPQLEAPSERPHPFAYFITILNDSKETVTILGRKWILKDLSEKDAETMVVEGRGVVGETPVLKPGQFFSYNSYHVIARDSEAGGAFFGTDAAGRGLRVKIPLFRLLVPPGQ